MYTISHTTPEVIPQLLYVVVPIPLPLSAILILVIDLGFELFVGLSFAWDPPETKDGLMRMGPRKPVNNKSITALKKRALRRTKTIRGDAEDQAPKNPSRVSQYVARIKAPFTRQFWTDLTEDTDNETLVDSKVLSYAYLEAGVIEFLAGYENFQSCLCILSIAEQYCFDVQNHLVLCRLLQERLHPDRSPEGSEGYQ